MPFAQQACGITPIVLFTVVIFQKMKANGQFGLSVIVASQITNTVNWLFSVIGASYWQSKFGQKRVLQVGMFLMALTHFGQIGFNAIDEPRGIIAMVACFQVCY